MLAGIVSNDKNLTWNRVFDIAEEAGHIDGIPLPVLQAIREFSLEDHDLVSASQICGCLRAAYLKRHIDYFEKPGKWLPLMMGTFTHWLLEQPPTNGTYQGLTELALQRTTSEGVVVTGHADHVDLEHSTLSDYKTTRWLKPANLPYGTHRAQVNVYRWLLEKNEIGPAYDTEHLQIVYIDLTGPARNGDHDGVVIKNIRKWDEQRIKNFVTDNANILYHADTDMPPKIERENQWMCRFCPKGVLDACNEYERVDF